MGSLIELLLVLLLLALAVNFVGSRKSDQSNLEIAYVPVVYQEQHKGPGCLPGLLIFLLLLPPGIALIRLVLLQSPGVVLLISG